MCRMHAVRSLALSSLVFGVLTLPSARASADDVADFYRGKPMQMVIRSTTGNEYDLLARTLARHITNHIPGKPAEMVPINMPGAGGIKAINMAYQVTKPDGLTFFQLSTAHILQQLEEDFAVSETL